MSAPGPWRDAAPTPRGPYQAFPQAPPPPMPEHPFAGVNRGSYYAAPIPGFYSPSLAQPAPGIPLGRGAPPFPRPELPPSLVPGRKPTYSFTRSNSDDYFFQGDSPILRSRQPQTPPAPAPPIPRKPDLGQPLLPPKPSFESSSASTSPTSPPLSYPRHHPLSYPRADAIPSAPPLPPPPPPPPPPAHHADDDVFNHVLDISVQEVERTKEMERQRLEQARMTEEAHLAMALEASLRIGPPSTMPERDGGSSMMTTSPEQGPSTAPLHSPIADISFSPAPVGGDRRARANSHVAQQIIDDEALALQLAQEEERLAEQERVRESNARARSSSQLAAAGGPPQYHEAVSSPPATSPGSLFPSVPAQSLLNTAGPSRSSSPHMPSLGRSVSDKPCPPKTVTPEKRVSRSQSLGDGMPSASTTILAPKPQTSRSISITSSSWEPTDDEDAHSPQSASAHTAEVPSNTQYLDSELLLGLCKSAAHVHCVVRLLMSRA
ncbi:hypothetical protein GY45DRAFT_1090766 [Cubamyces sp. BRFM 1775]|nr:hypothetical protein GY45DRAFT_1090766 [Cubamyces sp. BRFM 1775]